MSPFCNLTSVTLSNSSLSFKLSVKSLLDKAFPSSVLTFSSSFCCVAVDTGLSKSDVLSTLSRPTKSLSIPLASISIIESSFFLRFIFLLSESILPSLTELSGSGNVISLLSASSKYTVILEPSALFSIFVTLSFSTLCFNSSVKSLLVKVFPSTLSTLSSSASWVSFEIGFSASLVLSTLSNPTSDLSITSVTSTSVSSVSFAVIFLFCLL